MMIKVSRKPPHGVRKVCPDLTMRASIRLARILHVEEKEASTCPRLAHAFIV